MKLQYLGDSREAFKWDLLHWLCTRAEPALADAGRRGAARRADAARVVPGPAAGRDRRANGRVRWDGWCPERVLGNTLVFLDPDNGFETRTQRGPKWVRRWDDLFADLAARLDYAPNVQAVYEANLAFLVLSRARGTAGPLARVAATYGAGRADVRSGTLRGGANAGSS